MKYLVEATKSNKGGGPDMHNWLLPLSAMVRIIPAKLFAGVAEFTRYPSNICPFYTCEKDVINS